MEINRVIFNNFNIKGNGIKSKKNDLIIPVENRNYKPVSYPKSYYLQSFKGNNFKDRLTQELKKSSEEEFFIFLYNELRTRAKQKNIQHQITDDVVQDKIMDIFIIMNETDSQEEVVDKINEIYENLEAQPKHFLNKYEEISLNKQIGYDDDHNHLSIIDNIPDDEEHQIRYLSSPDEKTRTEQKQKLASVLSNAKLDETSEGLIKDRYLQDIPIKFKKIEEKYNISEQTAMLLIKRAFMKIQIANNSLPEETRKKIEDLSKILNTDYNSAQNAVLNNPYLLNHSPEELKEKIKGVTEAFKDNGLTIEKYSTCCVKHPQLLNKSAEGIEKNIRGVIEKFKDNISLNNYIKACVKQPSLFYQAPDNIEKKVNSVVKRFKNNGLTTGSYLKACIKYPSLFCSSSETVENNIKGIVAIFSKNGLTAEKYIKAACKTPSLFVTPPKTAEKNVKELVKKFENNNLTVDKYIKACIKNPPLFYQSPETIESNIKGLVEKFKNNGLTLDDYVKSACKTPTLFCLLPETVENKVKNMVDEYKDNGMTTEKYLHACVKKPQLFYSSADSLKNNVDEIVKAYKDNGLTTDDYVRCCLKQPSLFLLSPITIKNNINNLVNKYSDKGLTLNDYIQTCKMAPSLFQNCPDTVAEHIDIKRFSFYNTGKYTDEKQAINKIISNGIELSFSSKLLLIKYLIAPKIFEKNTMPKGFSRGGHLEEKLEKYIKDNPDKEYEIEIRNCNTTTDCIKILNEYLKELSQKALGKENIFHTKIIN